LRPDTLFPSPVYKYSQAAGSAALETESRESAKYSELGVVYTFVPIAVEFFGVWGPEASAFVSSWGGGSASFEESLVQPYFWIRGSI